jgi:hypothetical protein|tara:strand:+ start:39 stop:869 length:831 start_codon:yes stop_codon:yes gene_type:complete
MSSSDGVNPKKMLQVEDLSNDIELNRDSLNGEQKVLIFTTDNTSDEEEEGEENNFNVKYSCKNITTYCISIVLLIVVLVIVMFTVNNSEPEGITASIRGGTYSKETCDDYDYGCCEIYEKCKVVTTNGQHMDYKTINLDVYVTHAHDSIKSNCVSLRDIVNRYNRIYGQDDCGKHGCCPPINIGCDDVIHYHINDGNNQGLVDTYLENRTTLMPIKVPKNNTRGTNCWNNDGFRSGITHFTDKYNHNYPIPDNSTSFAPLVILGIGIWCLGCTKFK